jgi:multimeric flavodoxin WrbA
MRVLGLVGSPRKGSNTDLLVSQLLDGAAASSHMHEKVYLYDLNIKPCVDCRACKKCNFQCVIDDDMQLLYPKLENADVIVFGTPLYWYGPSGMMKLMFDRLRPFIASKKLKGRKAILIVPSEEGSSACDFLVDMFEFSFKYLEIDLMNKILVKAYEKAEIKEQPETMRSVFEVGKALK